MQNNLHTSYSNKSKFCDGRLKNRPVPGAWTAQTAGVSALHGDAEAAPEVERRATIARCAQQEFANSLVYKFEVFSKRHTVADKNLASLTPLLFFFLI